MVGDTTTDIQTGVNAGLRTILVRTGAGGKDGKWGAVPDFIFEDFGEAVDFILAHKNLDAGPIAEIAARIAMLRGKGEEVVVAVGGQARSGKSTFSALLQDAVEEKRITCKRISLDNWLLDRDRRTAGMTVRERFRYEDIARELHHIVAGSGTVDVKLYNPYTRTADPEKVQSLGGAPCLIVEGVPALDITGLRALSQIKVFVDCDETLRKERLRRFYRWKDLPEKEIENLLVERLSDEVPFIEESRTYADFIVRVP